jgi:hypothetical protein
VSFILPDFHMADRILDKVERDNADAVLVVSEWPHRPWWRRLASGAWHTRIAMSEFLPANILIPYNESFFFGGHLYLSSSRSARQRAANRNEREMRLSRALHCAAQETSNCDCDCN